MKKTGTFFLAKDDLKLGLLLGLITPILVLTLIYFLRFNEDYDYDEFITRFFQSKQLVTFVGTWSLVGNMVLFTYYINTRKHLTARGIFLITVLYGIGVLVLKLFI